MQPVNFAFFSVFIHTRNQFTALSEYFWILVLLIARIKDFSVKNILRLPKLFFCRRLSSHTVKKKSATLIFSPTYERWNIAMTTDTRVEGIIMPLSFLKQFSGEKLSLLATVITRWNRELGHSVGNSQQWGGFVLGSFKKKDHITYKLGLYYNHELFGEFFVPLLGIDWKINEKNNLFGVLRVTWFMNIA
jgi:hypothetical protein